MKPRVAFVMDKHVSIAVMALYGLIFMAPRRSLSGEKPFPEAAGLLRSIQSPIELLLPRLPPSYSVPVTLNGAAADEMNRLCEKLNVPPPQYEEVFDKNRRFHLHVTNADYPLETRECITGIFNPVEMIDIVVSSALKYRDNGMFSIMVKETIGSVSKETIDGKRAYRVQLRPTGKYFAYTYQDMGAFTRESWLTDIAVVLDSTSRLVRELTLHKYVRQFEASLSGKPPVDSFVINYLFSYADFGGASLPVRLRLRVNGALTLTLTASYRSLEKEYWVFDTREICCPQSGADSCLLLRYDDYRVGEVPPAIKNPVKPAVYLKNLERAAQLSQEAATALHNGNIETSVRACKKIVSRYPETPQAVEARRLLFGLPGSK